MASGTFACVDLVAAVLFSPMPSMVVFIFRIVLVNRHVLTKISIETQTRTAVTTRAVYRRLVDVKISTGNTKATLTVRLSSRRYSTPRMARYLSTTLDRERTASCASQLL